jgi:hypothetical protein
MMHKNRIIKYALLVFILFVSTTFAETQEIKEHIVIKGENLWDITKKDLNDPFLWPKVWKENPDIANPDLIYPNQIIKIPLYLIQKENSETEASTKPATTSQESAIVANQRSKEIDEKTIPKPTVASPESATVADERYKGIKGIVLQDGTVIEGQIIIMNAEIVKILTKDGNVLSTSFIKEVEYFIHE